MNGRLMHWTIRFVLFLVVESALAFGQGSNVSAHFRNIHLQKGERITGVEISLSAGCFNSVRPIPAGWTVTIDNDPSWKTTFGGDIAVGAAALDLEELQKWDISIRKYEYGDLRFKISGILHVSSDFKSERKIELNEENFVLRQSHSAPPRGQSY